MVFTHPSLIVLTGFLFLTVTVIHLIACYKRYPKTRTATKVLLMPLLCLFYLSVAREIRLLVVAAILFGWIGDVLLLLERKNTFMLLGIIAFALGHVCYISAILAAYPHPGLQILIPLALLAAWITFVCMKLLPYAPKSLRVPGLIYAILLSGTCLSALYELLCTCKGAYAIAFVGGLFFMLSDTLLTGQQYRKELRHGNFYVMLTYILAQLLLIVGLAQTGGIRIWNLPL